MKKTYMTAREAKSYLHEHIMIGDRGDGVPNFLSADDVFVTNGRQKQIRQKKLEAWLKQPPESFCTEDMMRGYKRNQQLVDLNFVPESLQRQILESYHAQAGKTRSKLFNYFFKKKLRNLITDLDQF